MAGVAGPSPLFDCYLAWWEPYFPFGRVRGVRVLRLSVVGDLLFSQPLLHLGDDGLELGVGAERVQRGVC